jgi:hypothetical protein
MSGQRLNVTPKRKQPSLEIVLGGVGMKVAAISYPRSHFPFCIGGVDEVVSPRVYVCQCDHCV